MHHAVTNISCKFPKPSRCQSQTRSRAPRPPKIPWGVAKENPTAPQQHPSPLLPPHLLFVSKRAVGSQLGGLDLGTPPLQLGVMSWGGERGRCFQRRGLSPRWSYRGDAAAPAPACGRCPALLNLIQAFWDHFLEIHQPQQAMFPRCCKPPLRFGVAGEAAH